MDNYLGRRNSCSLGSGCFGGSFGFRWNMW